MKNALTAIRDMLEEVVEQLFSAITLTGQGGSCTVMFNTVENVVLDEIWTPCLARRLKTR